MGCSTCNKDGLVQEIASPIRPTGSAGVGERGKVGGVGERGEVGLEKDLERDLEFDLDVLQGRRLSWMSWSLNSSWPSSTTLISFISSKIWIHWSAVGNPTLRTIRLATNWSMESLDALPSGL